MTMRTIKFRGKRIDDGKGYEEREFGPNSSLLVKELNQIK